MAASCVSGACRLAPILKVPFRCGIVTSNIVQRQSVKCLHSRFTWSHLKYLHSQPRVPISTVFSSSSSSRFSWRWMVMMATAGFTQGFLGFSFGKKDEDKKHDPLVNVYREAKEAHLKQDYKRAEVLYHDTLRVADEMLKLKKLNKKTYIFAKTNVYDSLADMALGQGELEKAERLYKETIKGCLQQGVAQDDNAIVELSLKLGSIYAMMERDKEAEQGFLFCINTQDAKLSATAGKSLKGSIPLSDVIKEAAESAKADNNGRPQSAEQKEVAVLLAEKEEQQRDTEALLGMALETYGRLMMGQRRLTEAVQALERARDVAGKVFGTEKSQYLVLVNDLATAHILLQQYDQAGEILTQAISTGTKIGSPHLPVLYCNLGALFLRRLKLGEAEEACLKGQELSNENRHAAAAVMSIKCLDKIAQMKEKAAS